LNTFILVIDLEVHQVFTQGNDYQNMFLKLYLNIYYILEKYHIMCTHILIYILIIYYINEN